MAGNKRTMNMIVRIPGGTDDDNDDKGHRGEELAN